MNCERVENYDLDTLKFLRLPKFYFLQILKDKGNVVTGSTLPALSLKYLKNKTTFQRSYMSTKFIYCCQNSMSKESKEDCCIRLD